MIKKGLKLYKSKNNEVIKINTELFFKFIFILIKFKNIIYFLFFIET
jgi:hypothetical protein